MKKWTCQLGFLATVLTSVAGCSDFGPKPHHTVTGGTGEYRIGCRLCYDEMVRVLAGGPKNRHYKVVTRHQCPECMTDVIFYMGDDDRLMIRCAKRAPEGVPCDRCIPPQGTTTQPNASDG